MRAKPFSQGPWWLRLWVQVNPYARRAYVLVRDQLYAERGQEVPAAVEVHERVHIAQWHRYGSLGMMLRYWGWPLPMGLAWTRYVLEREAYLAQGRYELERMTSMLYYRHEIGLEVVAEDLTERLCSPLYLWPWPRRWVAKWFREELGRS